MLWGKGTLSSSRNLEILARVLLSAGRAGMGPEGPGDTWTPTMAKGAQDGAGEGPEGPGLEGDKGERGAALSLLQALFSIS